MCWSPDGKYAVTGGEDDLVTVWSFEQRRVVARGEGHKSYINAVAFDPYMTTLPDPDLVSPTSSIQQSFRESKVADNPLQSATPLPSSETQTKAQTTESTHHNSHGKSTLDSIGTSHHLNRYLSKAGTELELDITAYRLGSVGQDTQLCLWDLSGDVLKPRRPFLRSRSHMSRHSRPVSMVDLALDTVATHATASENSGTTSTLKRSPNDPSTGTASSVNGSKEPHRTSSPGGEGADLAGTNSVGNHVISDSKRTSVSSHRESTAENAPEFSSIMSTTSEQVPSAPLQNPDDGRSSTPSTMSTCSEKEKGSGKKEKKSKKKDKIKQSTPKHTSNKDGESPSNSTDGEKYASKKSHRRSLSKVIKFVSSIGNSNVQHSYRRSVAAFESCMSDDIAPKMSEVNSIEPLVAKKISNERLTALVFHRDCIITACQEGFIHTWSRPGTEVELPDEEDVHREDGKGKKEPVSSVPSNPGVRCQEYAIHVHGSS